MNKNECNFSYLSQIYMIIITNSNKIEAKYVQWFLATSKHLKNYQEFDKAAPSFRKSLVHEKYDWKCFLNTKHTFKLKTLS